MDISNGLHEEQEILIMRKGTIHDGLNEYSFGQ